MEKRAAGYYWVKVKAVDPSEQWRKGWEIAAYDVFDAECWNLFNVDAPLLDADLFAIGGAVGFSWADGYEAGWEASEEYYEKSLRA